MFTFLETLNSTSLLVVGALSGAMLSFVIHRAQYKRKKIVNLPDQKIQPNQLIEQQAEAKNLLSADHLHNLNEILYQLTQETQQHLRVFSEILTQIENMHNFTTARSNYLANQFNLNQTSLEKYFHSFQAQQLFAKIRNSKSKMEHNFKYWSQSNQFSSKTQATTFAKFIENLVTQFNNTTTGQQLITAGYQPINLRLVNENKQLLTIEIAQLNTLYELFGAIYELMAIPLCNFIETETKIPHWPTIQLDVDLHQESLSLNFNNLIQRHSSFFYIPRKQDLKSQTQVQQITTKAFLSLLQLNADFKVKMQTFQNQETSKLFKLGSINFVCPVSMHKNKLQTKSGKETVELKAFPLENELLTSLSGEVDSVQIKKKDLTVH